MALRSVGPAWNDKLAINAELNLVDTNGPDMQLYRQVNKKYAPSVPLGSFGQMGFLDARLATQALMDSEAPEFTQKTVNEAFRDIKPFKTDILCKPWYFQKMKLHVPNNTDRTVTPKDGKMTTAQGCTPISAVDPQIAQYRSAAGTAPNVS